VSQLIGTVLGAGRYRIDELLGRGGQGTVYRGTHLALNIPVAIKVLPFSAAREKATEIRFKREAQRAATLRHPHIVTVYDYALEAGMYYIVSDLVWGSNASPQDSSQRSLRTPTTPAHPSPRRASSATAPPSWKATSPAQRTCSASCSTSCCIPFGPTLSTLRESCRTSPPTR